jgi:hypothetical protein
LNNQSFSKLRKKVTYKFPQERWIAKCFGRVGYSRFWFSTRATTTTRSAALLILESGEWKTNESVIYPLIHISTESSILPAFIENNCLYLYRFFGKFLTEKKRATVQSYPLHSYLIFLSFYKAHSNTPCLVIFIRRIAFRQDNLYTFYCEAVKMGINLIEWGWCPFSFYERTRNSTTPATD